MRCSAFQDRTGAYTCNRCGYQWDADEDAPDCQASKRAGHEALKHIREDLLK